MSAQANRTRFRPNHQLLVPGCIGVKELAQLRTIERGRRPLARKPDCKSLTVQQSNATRTRLPPCHQQQLPGYIGLEELARLQASANGRRIETHKGQGHQASSNMARDGPSGDEDWHRLPIALEDNLVPSKAVHERFDDDDIVETSSRSTDVDGNYDSGDDSADSSLV